MRCVCSAPRSRRTAPSYSRARPLVHPSPLSEAASGKQHRAQRRAVCRHLDSLLRRTGEALPRAGTSSPKSRSSASPPESSAFKKEATWRCGNWKPRNLWNQPPPYGPCRPSVHSPWVRRSMRCRVVLCRTDGGTASPVPVPGDPQSSRDRLQSRLGRRHARPSVARARAVSPRRAVAQPGPSLWAGLGRP